MRCITNVNVTNNKFDLYLLPQDYDFMASDDFLGQVVLQGHDLIPEPVGKVNEGMDAAS